MRHELTTNGFQCKHSNIPRNISGRNTGHELQNKRFQEQEAQSITKICLNKEQRIKVVLPITFSCAILPALKHKHKCNCHRKKQKGLNFSC
jgi:hypothetical protein